MQRQDKARDYEPYVNESGVNDVHLVFNRICYVSFTQL